MSDAASLRADCGRCAGLCCVALAFDRSALFGHDKPAGTACIHLDALDRCSIHAERAEEGYGGCLAYDCLGAGQAVTQLFAGRSWRSQADGGRAMFAAFAIGREVQHWRQLLISAKALPLTGSLAARRVQLLDQLSPDSWSLGWLAQIQAGRMAAEVADFLVALRRVVPDSRRRQGSGA